MGRSSLLTPLVIGGLVTACGGTSTIMMPPERDALCSADLDVTGTFDASATPDPTMGCQPDGTWMMTAAIHACQSDTDCNTAPCTNGKCSSCMNVPLAQSYTIDVTGMVHSGSGMTETITNVNAVTNETDALEINGEDDACNGSFVLILPDQSQFDYLELQPSTPAYCPNPTQGSNGTVCGANSITTTTISLTGVGEYQLWAQHP